MSKLIKISSFVFLIVFLVSCIKRKEYPKEPVIKFLSFDQTPDSAFLNFSFTDGDGDLGLNANDTTAPYNIKGTDFYNIYISYFEKENGVFKLVTLSSPFNYRFPRIESQSKTNELVGKMKIKIPAPYYNPLLSVGDTVKYEFYIADRALNKSNITSSGDVVIKY